MTRIAFLLVFVAHAQGCCAVAPQPPAECPVIIGYGGYDFTQTTPVVVSSNTGAAFLSDYHALFDGRPSSKTAIAWGTGAQTTASFTAVEFSVASGGVSAPVGIVGILNTNLPAGLLVNIRVGGSGSGMLGSGTFQENSSGKTDAWVIFDNVGLIPGNTLITQFMNAVGGSTSIASGATITIGEIFAAQRSDWLIKRTPKFTFANTQKLRPSSSGAQWPVIVPQIRVLSVDFVPVPQKQAFNSGGTDLTATFKNIASSAVVAILPFTECDPALYPRATDDDDAQMIAKTAFLGAFLQPPAISMNGEQLYDATMTVQESI